LARSARVSGGRFFSSTRAVASLADSVKQAIKVSFEDLTCFSFLLD
jgi:hypothetical protein